MGLFKYWRSSFHMRALMFNAIEVVPIDKRLATNIIRYSLTMARKTPQWKYPVFDLKTHSFLWLLSGLQNYIIIGLETQNSVTAGVLKELFLTIVLQARKKPILKINPYAIIAAEEQYEALP